MATCSFKISGEFITKHHRNLVLEGSWIRALKSLSDTLAGMTYDYDVELLSGKIKLIGTSGTKKGIESAKEDPKDVVDYLKAVRYFYGGAFRKSGDVWYKPYAIVTNFGKYDAKNVHFDRNNSHSLRALHYANSVRDISYSLVVPETPAMHCETLFQKVTAPPVWLSMPKTPQEAVDEYLKIERRLDERGHRQKYGYLENSIKIAALKIPQHIDRESEKLREDRIDKEMSELKNKIIAKAEKNGGFFDLIVKYPKKKEEKIYKIPYIPFKAWVLGDYDMWNPICPTGLKMSNDDALHSDWVVGAGIDIDKLYGFGIDKYFNDAVWSKRIVIEEEYNKNFIVLRGSGKVTGKITHPEPDEEMLGNEIIVVPNLRSDYYIPATKALAVISEMGGEMSHLTNVSENFKIMRVHEALTKYKVGDTVTVDFDNRTVEIRE